MPMYSKLTALTICLLYLGPQSGAAFINLSHNFAYNRRIRARIANGEIAPDDWRPWVLQERHSNNDTRANTYSRW